MTIADSAVTSETMSREGAAFPQMRTDRGKNKRTFWRALRRGLLVLLVLAAVGGTALALRPRPVPVDGARASRGPLVVAIEESGTTRVHDRYVVSAPVAGNV